MLNIILCGAPGSGKGTQSDLIVEKYGLQHLSTGDALRAEIKSGSELGKEIGELIAGGNLVPDHKMIHLIERYLDNLPEDCKGVIFDGFPRTTAQAEIFDTLLAEIGSKVDAMIYMDVPEEELVKRILLRGKDSGRADDASEDVIRNRIEVYRAQTAIVADHYTKQNKYHEINGLGTFDEVFDRLVEVIDAKR